MVGALDEYRKNGQELCKAIRARHRYSMNAT
jgi:hypothetical protein